MGQQTTVIPTGGAKAKVQNTTPVNPEEGSLWVDTSKNPAITKWYNGTTFVEVVPVITNGTFPNL